MGNFEKARIHVVRLRDNFQKYKRDMTDIDKLTQIEDDLLSTIFNTKEIVNEIAANKRDHNDLLKKVLESIQYGDNYMDTDYIPENIFQIERSGGNNYYVDKYYSLGIRNPVLDMFERDYKTYVEFEKLFSTKDLGNYRKFAITCSRFTKW